MSLYLVLRTRQEVMCLLNIMDAVIRPLTKERSTKSMRSVSLRHIETNMKES